MANFMDKLFKSLYKIKDLFSVKSVKIYTSGPNTLEELLKQFDQPLKEKTQEDYVRDYIAKETMAALEVEMLKMDPTVFFQGTQTWYEGDVKCFDFVPCSLRPEVIYCSYGKN